MERTVPQALPGGADRGTDMGAHIGPHGRTAACGQPRLHAEA
jgi:hypothetical protein